MLNVKVVVFSFWHSISLDFEDKNFFSRLRYLQRFSMKEVTKALKSVTIEAARP